MSILSIRAAACAALCTLSATAAVAAPHNHYGARESIGTMAHSHENGDWMFSYRYSRMEMDGNRDGTNNLSPSEVLNDFLVTPTQMTVQMHMIGAMYGATEDLTLMVMAPYVVKSMDHVTATGVLFTTESEGIGDIQVGGTYTLIDFGDSAKDEGEDQAHRHGYGDELLLNFALSLPTGSITESDATPMGANQRLPYPMQLGSGTFDPILGLTYLGNRENFSFGGQANARFRLGINGEGYRLGNEYTATAWIAKQLNSYIGASFRLDGRVLGNIDGQDSLLNPAVVPTARTDLRGGERVDALVGVDFAIPGVTGNQRLAAEFGVPVYQRLDGPQLELDYRFVVGWQGIF